MQISLKSNGGAYRNDDMDYYVGLWQEVNI
jgi:hypothetical protein